MKIVFKNGSCIYSIPCADAKRPVRVVLEVERLSEMERMGYCNRSDYDEIEDDNFDCFDYMECEECPYWECVEE